MQNNDAVDAEWQFEVEEQSAGVFRVTGTDANGNVVERTGTNPDELIVECKAEALRLVGPN